MSIQKSSIDGRSQSQIAKSDLETYSRNHQFITRKKFVLRAIQLRDRVGSRTQIIFRNGFHLTFRSNRGIKKFRAWWDTMEYDNGRRRPRYYTKSLHRVALLLEFRMKFTSKDNSDRRLIRGQRSPWLAFYKLLNVHSSSPIIIIIWNLNVKYEKYSIL